MTAGWAFHGGRLDEARGAYGEGPEPWLDLSTGINPHAWPGADAVPIDWRRLPGESALAALEAAAAERFGIDAAHVCALPGTEAGLRLTGTILTGPAFHVAPAYRTHAAMIAGSRPIGFDNLAGARGATVILANPNNPDGRVIPASSLAAHLDRLAAASGWLVIDEAFADALPGISLAAAVRDDRPLMLFRSFGKFFGLAGVRLGFVLGPRPLIARFRDRLGSWPVSAAAIAIGTAAYRDGDWIVRMRPRLRAEAAALDAMLARHGLAATGGCPLFRLIEVDDAAALFDRLARRAILTRPFDHDPRRLRIGLPGSDDALARLDCALGDG